MRVYQRAVCLLFVVALGMAHAACLSKRKEAFYSLYSIGVVEGKEVYVKRMVWGPALDQSITVISTNRDLYDLRQTHNDYVFDWYQPSIYYKVENGTLVLYLYELTAQPPEGEQFPFKVEQVVLDFEDWRRLMDNYKNAGINRIELSISENLRRQL
jgi:hypothetical protein